MKKIPGIKYLFLLINLAISCYICITLSDVIIILGSALHFGGGLIRSLQYGVLALGTIGVLLSVGLMDKRFEKIALFLPMAVKFVKVAGVQLILLGMLLLCPFAYGMQSGWAPLVSFILGASLLAISRLLNRVVNRKEKKRKEMRI